MTQYGAFQFQTKMEGEYSLCLANEYSADAKLIYLDVVDDNGEEDEAVEESLRHGAGALDQVETLTT